MSSSMQPAPERPESVPRRTFRWIVRRWEVLIPLLALLIFQGMAGSGGAAPPPWTRIAAIGLAVVHIVLVLWQPMSLSQKEPRPFDRAGLFRAARVVVPAVIVGVLISTLLRAIAGRVAEGSKLWGLASILLIALFGSLGLVAEGRLPVDLLPVFRRRGRRSRRGRREGLRIFYVLVASFSLALVGQLWAGIAEDIAGTIGQQAFGEAGLDVEGAASSFNVASPLRLLVGLLIGAGLFEELLFRLGILTLVWALTRRYSIGLLVSAVLFGLYHITPLSGMEAYLATPFTAAITSAAMGVYMGLVYRYRGFAAAVLVHGLGDWIVIMMITAIQ